MNGWMAGWLGKLEFKVEVVVKKNNMPQTSIYLKTSLGTKICRVGRDGKERKGKENKTVIRTKRIYLGKA